MTKHIQKQGLKLPTHSAIIYVTTIDVVTRIMSPSQYVITDFRHSSAQNSDKYIGKCPLTDDDFPPIRIGP